MARVWPQTVVMGTEKEAELRAVTEEGLTERGVCLGECFRSISNPV